MTKKKICVSFAIACAEKYLPIFEQAYPDDDKPRKAIEAAKKWLQIPTETNAEKSKKATLASEETFNEIYEFADTEAYELHAVPYGDANNADVNAIYAAAFAVNVASYASNAAANTAYLADVVEAASNASKVFRLQRASVIDDDDASIEILWQRQTLRNIIKDYKKLQIYALINPKDKTIVGNLQPDILRLVYEYL